MVSYERDDLTLGIGAYEDDCHMKVDNHRLPFGMGEKNTNLPSMNEVHGHHSVTSMTWDNEEHGESAHEHKMLDLIEAQEKKEDESVQLANQPKVMVSNEEFENVVNVQNSVIV